MVCAAYQIPVPMASRLATWEQALGWLFAEDL